MYEIQHSTSGNTWLDIRNSRIIIPMGNFAPSHNTKDDAVLYLSGVFSFEKFEELECYVSCIFVQLYFQLNANTQRLV